MVCKWLITLWMIPNLKFFINFWTKKFMFLSGLQLLWSLGHHNGSCSSLYITIWISFHWSWEDYFWKKCKSTRETNCNEVWPRGIYYLLLNPTLQSDIIWHFSLQYSPFSCLIMPLLFFYVVGMLNVVRAYRTYLFRQWCWGICSEKTASVCLL